MAFQKTYRLLIPPQPQVVMITSEKWMLSTTLTDQYLLDLGMKKHTEQKEAGAKNPVNPNHYLNKKKRYLRYVKYMQDLKAEANRNLYFPRTDNFWMKFFIGMPKSWSKKKKKQLCFEPNLQKPDCSNFVKAIEDSLFEEDKIIWDFRASKFWYDGPGHIEIEIGTLPKATGYTKYVKEDILQ